MWTFFYMMILFAFTNVYSYVAFTILLVCLIILGKLPAKLIYKAIKPILFLAILSFLLNLFGNGENYTDNGFYISLETLEYALLMAVRLILLVVGSSLLTYTTTPLSLTDGIEAALKPFARFGMPAHEIAMMMSIALRFIPTLLDETARLMDAQKSRGANFSTGSIFKRGKALLPLLIPLFVSAFRRADELAVAMESRCYNCGKGMTRLEPLELKKIDYMAMVFMGVSAVLAMVLTVI